MKQLIAKLLTLALCLSLCTVPAFAADDPQDVWGDVQQDNFVRITSSEAWNKGTFENTVLTEEVGNGAIRLAERTQGRLRQDLHAPLPDEGNPRHAAPHQKRRHSRPCGAV